MTENYGRVVPGPPSMIAALKFGVNDPAHDGATDDDTRIEIPWSSWRMLAREVAEVEAERDRARALAAKLEEVIAMRTAIVKAVADRNPDERPDQMIAVQAWARAQLQEIP